MEMQMEDGRDGWSLGNGFWGALEYGVECAGVCDGW